MNSKIDHFNAQFSLSIGIYLALISSLYVRRLLENRAGAVIIWLRPGKRGHTRVYIAR